MILIIYENFFFFFYQTELKPSQEGKVRRGIFLSTDENKERKENKERMQSEITRIFSHGNALINRIHILLERCVLVFLVVF
jgi:hypothetical protein